MRLGGGAEGRGMENKEAQRNFGDDGNVTVLLVVGISWVYTFVKTLESAHILKKSRSFLVNYASITLLEKKC